MRHICPKKVTVTSATFDSARIQYPNCTSRRVSSSPSNFLDLRNQSIQIVYSLPQNVIAVDLSYNPLETLLDSKNNVKRVVVHHCSLKSLTDFSWPKEIEYLDIAENVLSSLRSLSTFPTLRHIIAARNNITILEELPIFLESLDVSGNAIQEIIDYDFPYKLSYLNMSNNAALQQIRNITLHKNCAIDFQGVPLRAYEQMVMAYHTQSSESRKLMSEHLLRSLTTYVVLGTVSILLLLSIYLLYRYFHRDQRHHRHLSPMNSEIGPHTPVSKSSQWQKLMKKELPIRTRKFSLHNMFYRVAFSNSEILKVRIPGRQLRPIRTLSRRGQYVTFVAELRKPNSRQVIAVKQLLKNSETDQNHINSFLQEIDRCFRLRHPNLVPFVGVVWDYLSELAYACEYMERGNLMSILQYIRKNQIQNSFHWYPLPSPITIPSKKSSMQMSQDITMRSKLEYALEIVNGLLYLHSRHATAELNEPIYQDFSSKSVFIDEDFSVLLSLFDIYKTMSLETMLGSQATTTAWIAPEVLKCNKCDEKATVYSLGVILTELDTCDYPYQNGIGEFLPANSSNARIAMMVGANMVQPSLSAECPDEIRSIIRSCLENEKEDRWTLSDVHVAIQELLRIPSAI